MANNIMILLDLDSPMVFAEPRNDGDHGKEKK